jgi:hypothetical protein
MSQAFYRDRLWTQLGYSSLEDWLVGAWEGNFLRRDALDLLAHIHTWQHFSIADDPAHGGDLERAHDAGSLELELRLDVRNQCGRLLWGQPLWQFPGTSQGGLPGRTCLLRSMPPSDSRNMCL